MRLALGSSCRCESRGVALEPARGTGQYREVDVTSSKKPGCSGPRKSLKDGPETAVLFVIHRVLARASAAKDSITVEYVL